MLVTLWWIYHHDPEDIVKFSEIEVSDKYESNLKLHRKDVDLEISKIPLSVTYVKYLGKLTQNSQNFPTLHKIARHDDVSCLYFQGSQVIIRTFNGKMDKLLCEIARNTTKAKNVIEGN